MQLCGVFVVFLFPEVMTLKLSLIGLNCPMLGYRKVYELFLEIRQNLSKKFHKGRIFLAYCVQISISCTKKKKKKIKHCQNKTSLSSYVKLNKISLYF